MLNFTRDGVSDLRFTSKLWILEGLNICRFCLHKMVWHDVNEMSFSPIVAKDFFFWKYRDVSNWGWMAYWKFRANITRRFFSYRKNPGRGRIYPFPSGTRVKSSQCQTLTVVHPYSWSSVLFPWRGLGSSHSRNSSGLELQITSRLAVHRVNGYLLY